MNSLQPKVLIIGIDGATFSLIKPWAEDGKLPTFQSLLQEGVQADLQSTIPPITAPAWTSFMTGMNPGKHGIFDFLEPRANVYQMQYTSGRSRRFPTVWRLLNDAGLSVGVMNVPMTYPPEPVIGYMISGMDSPDPESDLTHPPSLKEELKRAVGGIELDIRHLGNMRSDNRRDDTLRALEALEERRTRIAQYMMEKYPTDVVMLYYNATDQVQHHFWHYQDPSHPFYDASGAKRYGDAIYRMYKVMNDQIAKILRSLPEQTVIIVLSDHGGGPVSVREVYLNRYMEKLGFLHREWIKASPWSPKSWMEFALHKVDTTLRAVLTPTQKNTLAKRVPGARGKLESLLSFWGIDWSRTRAYAVEISAASPSIWINLKGRQPRGTVEPGVESDRLLAEIEARLLELKDPDTGKPVIPAIYRKEAVYHGRALEQAPDLILAWWEEEGFLAKSSFPCLPGAPVVQRSRRMTPGANWSGNHTFNGILLLCRGAFKKAYVMKDAKIVDIAPTLLALLGIPIPDNMDGNVLEDAFENRFLSSARWTYRRADEEISAPKERGYTEEEAEKIGERLKGLGYIE